MENKLFVQNAIPEIIENEKHNKDFVEAKIKNLKE